MKAVVYLSDDPLHARCLRAFAAGVPKGVTLELRPVTDYTLADTAVVFGVFKKNVPVSWPRGEIMRRQKQAGGRTVVIDSGYVKRGMEPTSYYMVGFDGINGWADFRNKGMPSDRWDELGTELKLWRDDGEAVILCGQVPWDASVQALDMLDWLPDTAREIRARTQRKVIYRPHPAARQHPGGVPGCETSTRPLAEDLAIAHCVVCYNSNSAVEAIIDGVPAIVLGNGAMSEAVAERSLDNIEQPRRPDRKQWVYDLAYCQWQPQEMAQGKAWRHLFR